MRIITIYAAVAFVILQLVEILAPSLRLPEWTMNFILVILIVGFILAIILSWIYDIHPEGGIIKTKPAHEVKPKVEPKASISWKVASYISFVLIIGLIVLNIIPRASNNNEILEKSLAVLPFIDDSPDKNNEHIINGIMEDLLINLQSIQDLRVPGRTSTEQYRNNPKPIPEIAAEMNVAYIVEGSGQRYGDKIRLRVQLVDGATDRHIWAESYDEVVSRPEDIFRIQTQIAFAIATELQAIITTEEKEIIKKIPTSSLTAYDFYQRGREDYLRNWIDNRNNSALERAEELFIKALELDPSFAQAYVGLARLYWAKQGFRTYFEEYHLDSMLFLCDLALSYNDQLAEAYTIKGFYYMENGDNEQAIKEFDKAIKYNPNDWETYRWKGRVYLLDDLVEYIDNFSKAASLNRGSELPTLLRRLAFAYSQAGFFEKAQFYRQEAFKLDGDSIEYYTDLAAVVSTQNNFDKSAEFLVKAYEIDTFRIDILRIVGRDLMYAGKFEESLKYYRKFLVRIEDQGIVNPSEMHRIGYAYWKNGYKKEADYYFDAMIEYYYNFLKQGRATPYANYDLAGVYAFRGEKEKAYENLRIFNQIEVIPRWWLEIFRRDPLFDSIRNEPEFQQIAKDVEAKYQAERERVRKWLEENDML